MITEEDKKEEELFLERIDQKTDILLVDDSSMNLTVLESLLKFKFNRH